MKELDPDRAKDMTAEEIYRYGIREIATTAPGGHADPDNPCYGEKRKYKDFAVRIDELAERRRSHRVPNPTQKRVLLHEETGERFVVEPATAGRHTLDSYWLVPLPDGDDEHPNA